jgi:hypothetical protein
MGDLAWVVALSYTFLAILTQAHRIALVAAFTTAMSLPIGRSLAETVDVEYRGPVDLKPFACKILLGVASLSASVTTKQTAT